MKGNLPTEAGLYWVRHHEQGRLIANVIGELPFFSVILIDPFCEDDGDHANWTADSCELDGLTWECPVALPPEPEDAP